LLHFVLEHPLHYDAMVASAFAVEREGVAKYKGVIYKPPASLEMLVSYVVIFFTYAELSISIDVARSTISAGSYV
jgi:hypothetical protein